MKKIKRAVFFAEKLPSGFYAIYANGDPNFINASCQTPGDVRDYIDKVTRFNGITSFTETFNKESYEYFLAEYAKLYSKETSTTREKRISTKGMVNA